MSYHFLPYSQDQLLLLPPSLQEWVHEDSLARFVSDVVDELDRSGRLGLFYQSYRADGWGAAAYHPVMLVKVLLYGYSVGLTSSRKLAQALELDVAFRYLAANQQPDHRTLAGFRTGHRQALEQLFVEILELCRSAGLVKLGRVALDGRRVAGNAALDQNRTRAKLQEQVEKLLEEAAQVDAEEDRQYGQEQRGDELPAALRDPTERLRRLQKALQELEQKEKALQQEQAEVWAQREEQERRTGKKKRGPKPKKPEQIQLDAEARANTTDPESRILKTRRGWVQGYNAQAMAECDSQVIVAQQITQETNDLQQLGPMLEGCQRQAGGVPEELLADAGYWSEATGEKDGQGGTELFVATVAHFGEGKHPQRDRMEEKLKSERGKSIYAQRQSTIEPVFGQMQMRGLQRFVLRGKAKVQLEWSLWCTTHNLLKLWRAVLRAGMPAPVLRAA